MVNVSAEKPVFLALLLSVVKGYPEYDATWDATHDDDTVSTTELCECLDILQRDTAALERINGLSQYGEWSAFYDYIKGSGYNEDVWPIEGFDSHLAFAFSRLVKREYEYTNDADYAYLYARILFDLANEEVYEQSLLDGYYTGVYRKADMAVDALASAWKRTPNRTCFTRVMWGYKKKREFHSVEYSDSVIPNVQPTPWVDEEIKEFLKGEEVTEEYIRLPECTELLQLINEPDC